MKKAPKHKGALHQGGQSERVLEELKGIAFPIWQIQKSDQIDKHSQRC